MLLRKGDRVSLEAEVREDFDSAVASHVALRIRQDYASVRAEEVTLVKAAFVTGDHVVVFDDEGKDTGLRGEIVAINGVYLWLDCGPEEMCTALAYRCQRVEAAVPTALHELLHPAPPAPLLTDHTVKEGDTIEKIAGVYADTVDGIRARNGIEGVEPLIPGTVLRVEDNIPF